MRHDSLLASTQLTGATRSHRSVGLTPSHGLAAAKRPPVLPLIRTPSTIPLAPRAIHSPRRCSARHTSVTFSDLPTPLPPGLPATPHWSQRHRRCTIQSSLGSLTAARAAVSSSLSTAPTGRGRRRASTAHVRKHGSIQIWNPASARGWTRQTLRDSARGSTRLTLRDSARGSTRLSQRGSIVRTGVSVMTRRCVAAAVALRERGIVSCRGGAPPQSTASCACTRPASCAQRRRSPRTHPHQASRAARVPTAPCHETPAACSRGAAAVWVAPPPRRVRPG